YVPGAADTPEAEAMRTYFKAKKWEEDLFTPDGFNAAQMVVEAVRAGGAKGDTDAMVKALEGFSFSGVKGPNTVRAADHALLQPTFQAQFTAEGAPRVARTFPAEQVAPAETRIG
ncbi:ABC transporter substrate-binding protein, partial [Streptomyces albogriseolus]